MNFIDFLSQNIVKLDGSMGTLLQQMGLPAGTEPVEWNMTNPQAIEKVHLSYFDAGSNVICTNTFRANPFHFEKEKLKDIIFSAVKIAKKAKEKSKNTEEKFIALDVGPTGKLLKPLGDLDFEDAVSAFKETVRLGTQAGADLIYIETMTDLYEAKAAILGAKEASDLPIMISFAFEEDGNLLTGADPETCVALAESMGAIAVGTNCSLGPKALRGVVEKLLSTASIPVIFKPNAGLPKQVDNKTVFDITPEEFAEEVKISVEKGVCAVGGCCGTTPEYISLLSDTIKDLYPKEIIKKEDTVISSYTHSVFFGENPVLIGERINPTGKKRFKQALLEKDFAYILDEGVRQAKKGAHALDVNVGLPEIDEPDLLCETVRKLQAVLDLPLQIDSSDPKAMESALRIYNGKALINSVSGKEESMNAVFPLVKKYGGVLIALTLDENGIPKKAEDRVKIAEKILYRAKEYGIEKKDIIIDPLAMTISTDPATAEETLKAVKMIREDLKCHTSLGVSNISFGLPSRDLINSTFFALALENGLSAAIMNPDSLEMMKTYFSYRALKGLDKNFTDFISFASLQDSAISVQKTEVGRKETDLYSAIENGLSEKAGELTKEELKNIDPLALVNEKVIPALNSVGEKFEQKKIYLPQLLMSAEAAKASFDVIKEAMSENGNSAKKGAFVLATVKGDIHDIGKNIVKLLMENYGYDVIDLGKDVDAKTICEKVLESGASLLGLSALMTTTVPAMEETISLIREKAPFCRVVVGGAVLTPEYAEKIGADFYAKDAMEAVRIAEKVFGA